jgi:hypothetical protein
MSRFLNKLNLCCVLLGLLILVVVSCMPKDHIQREPTSTINMLPLSLVVTPTIPNSVDDITPTLTPAIKKSQVVTMQSTPTPFLSTLVLSTHEPTETSIRTVNATSFLLLPPTNSPPVLYHNWMSFTNANYIRAMLVDHNGDLWTGGSGGVVHWDISTGEYVKFTAEHGLANNFVTSIAQTADGVLWIGTRGGGISRYDGSMWKTYTTQTGIPDNFILSMAVVDNTLWIQTYLGTDGDILKIDGQTIIISSNLGKSTILVAAPDGVVWRGGYESGLECYDGKGWKSFNDHIKGWHVTALAVTPDGTLWVGAENSVIHYDGKSWISHSLWENEQEEGGSPEIVTIAPAPDGSIWFGVSLQIHGELGADREEPLFQGQYNHDNIKGVYRLSQGTWSLITTDDGLVDNEIRIITAGSDGKLWFGSFAKGVSSYDGLRWNTYQTNDNILSNNINIIAVSNEGIWLGHPWGISTYTGIQWFSYNKIGELRGSEVFTIHIDPYQSVWFGALNGVVKYDGINWITYGREKYYWLDSIVKIQTLPGGILIFGGVGVSEFDGTNWDVLDKLDKVSISEILVHPNGTIWFIGEKRGNEKFVYSYDGRTWTDYTKESDFGKDRVTSSVVAPNGMMLFLTCHGVTSYDGKMWMKECPSDELGTGCLNGGIAVSDDGIVWIGSENGLLRYDGKTWELLKSSGISDNVIYDISMGVDGVVWIATHAGLSRYTPPEP